MEADEKVGLGVKRLPDGGQHTAGEPVMLLEERRVKAESSRKPVLIFSCVFQSIRNDKFRFLCLLIARTSLTFLHLFLVRPHFKNHSLVC